MNAKQLKNSILQMAIQGKLVPQDPNDQPASILLEKIRAEKEKLIKIGKIKKEKNPSIIFRGTDNLPYEKIGNNEPICIADEVPFDIPDSWEWTRLGSICQLTSGIKIEGKFYNNLDARYMRGNSKPKTISSGKFVKKGTHLILVDGENSGEVFNAPEDGYMGSTFKVLWFSTNISEQYLLQFIKLNKEFLRNSKKGAAIPHLNKYLFFNLLLPIPPIEEEERIIDRIEILEPLIRKYGLLEKLSIKLDNSFPEQLKKSILQEAVQGKLVPQDPNDEPASILLERIKAEKEKLIKEGKIKKEKHKSIIFKRDNSHYEKLDGVERCIDDEIPFEIPESWCWCRLGNIGETNIGLTYKPSDKSKKGTLVLRSSNIQNGIMSYTDNVYVTCTIPERAMIYKGDLLICARNGSRNLVGKNAILDIDSAAFGAFMAKFTSEFNAYIKIFLESSLFRNQLEGVKTETINQITQDVLKGQLIPLPPLAEQQRIVEKVKHLFKICEKL